MRTIDWILTGAGLLVLTAPAIAGPKTESPRSDLVSTSSGTVTGVATSTGMAYKGIPYAAPPVGPLRWRSPQPPLPWDGTRRADMFGAPCAQLPSGGRTEVSAASREDCLYLNVWTPRQASKAGYPVLVWIHGGGFQNGMGTSPTYDGAVLADKGVIVVTINYRLGVFGFLAHPKLTQESTIRSSGNYGLEDQIAALRWVARNIRNFGGDPKNVTIFGQSAGGASVLDLVVSQQVKGLFHRAIVQSGAARDAMVPAPLGQAEAQGEIFAGGRTIAELRSLETAAVLDSAAQATRSGVRFAPVRDSVVIDDAPVSLVRDNRASGLRILVGSNSREGIALIQPEELDAKLDRAFGANVRAARAAYGLLNDARGDAKDPLMGTPAQQFATDSTFRCGSVELVQAAAEARIPVWQYQFEHFVPGKEAQGAAHSYEVPYVFGNLSNTGFSAANYGKADRALSELMASYWVNFARTGNPNGPGLPRWPAYRQRSKSYLRLSGGLAGNAAVAADLRGELCRLFVR